MWKHRCTFSWVCSHYGTRPCRVPFSFHSILQPWWLGLWWMDMKLGPWPYSISWANLYVNHLPHVAELCFSDCWAVPWPALPHNQIGWAPLGRLGSAQSIISTSTSWLWLTLSDPPIFSFLRKLREDLPLFPEVADCFLLLTSPLQGLARHLGPNSVGLFHMGDCI